MADVKRTAMIGLGAMGLQMGRHMVKHGFEVMGYDISAEAAKKAESHGVRICGSVADAGKSAEVVFVMVANDKQIHDVIERSGLLDVLDGLPETTRVASSTGSWDGWRGNRRVPRGRSRAETTRRRPESPSRFGDEPASGQLSEGLSAFLARPRKSSVLAVICRMPLLEPAEE